jgi:hypothetical protein
MTWVDNKQYKHERDMEETVNEFVERIKNAPIRYRAYFKKLVLRSNYNRQEWIWNDFDETSIENLSDASRKYLERHPDWILDSVDKLEMGKGEEWPSPSGRICKLPLTTRIPIEELL